MKQKNLPVLRMGFLIGAAIGLIVGIAITRIVTNTYFTGKHASKASENSQKPLYWVAPMDPNYKREEPGLSPMGMELIPVYNSHANGDDSPGTIFISPDVVNNLGVRTSLVEKKQLQNSITTVGYIKYDQNKLIHIHPRVSGWVENLYVTATGDPVKQGEPLYSLYSPELVNAQQELVLAINSNNARLIQAS